MEIPENCNDYNLPDMFINELYLLLKRTTDLCHENNINYWIDGGTLLGCVREKNQIPYDNDVDLGMLQDDYTKFIKICVPILRKEFNYFCEEQAGPGFLKILSAVCGLQNTDDENNIVSPCLDIIVYHNFNGIIAIKERYIRHYYSKFRFLENNLFPLKREYIYKDLKLYGAINPYPYLERCYGDWNKRIYELKEYEINKT
jgi:phosphorylcholine metabolism protein LicD